MSAVRLDNVDKVYRREAGEPVQALDGLSFTVEAGEYVAILGRSGCGKSTTVGLLLGLDRPTGGTVEILGLDPVERFEALRGRLGCIFQQDRLLPWRSAIDNVALPLELEGIRKAERLDRSRAWLGRLGLADFAHSLPHQLSGGMRQRVAIARAMVANPALVIADEAFSGLDAITGQTLLQDFRQLTSDSGQTVIQITHSIDEALAVSDRILVFAKPGRCCAEFRNERNAASALRGAILAALEGDVTLKAAAE